MCSKLLELFLREVSPVKDHRRNCARVPDVFKRIAIEPDFDPEAETPMAIGVLKALFSGALRPDEPAPGVEA